MSRHLNSVEALACRDQEATANPDRQSVDFGLPAPGEIVCEPGKLDGPRRRRDPFGPQLRGRDLSRRAFFGHDFEGADLRQCCLREADLRGANLYGAWLDGADLRGARFDMTRIVEIALPETLPLAIVNQIRHFDFRSVMTRFVGANPHSEPLPCPYREARVVPLLYRWGSDTWNRGADWTKPAEPWTLEEIIAAVLDCLGCRHDLNRPYRTR